MNPFRVVEKILNIIGQIIFWTLCAVSVILIFGALVLQGFKSGWGWWSLLLIPGVPALFILAGVGWWLLEGVGDSIGVKWRAAKWRWDAKREQKEDQS